MNEERASASEIEGAVETVCGRHLNMSSELIEILHDLQDMLGYVPESALPVLAKKLNLSRAEVHGVVSFYHDFRHNTAGRVTVKICSAEACQSMGALPLIEEFCRRNGVTMGETKGDGSLTVEPVYCLGNCALSPAAEVNGRPMARVDAAKLDAAVKEARV